MKHLKEYFNEFGVNKLGSLLDELYQDGWKISKGNLVNSHGEGWFFGDIDHYVSFSRDTFNIIVESYKIFLEFQDIINVPVIKKSEKIQEKLESANSKTEVPVEFTKVSTKEYISLRRRKYVKIE